MTDLLFIITSALLLVAIVLVVYLVHENKVLKKERDYYIELDEENEQLRKEK